MTVCEKLLLNVATIDRYGMQKNQQAIAITKGHIVWYGAMCELPQEYQQSAKEVTDCQNDLITPGLIDCHTHLVYAGHRADEFKLRLEGLSYADIAKQGGGIVSTVKKTRAASEDELLEQSLPRLLALAAEGVTTIEIKSGYGLDLNTEAKLLRVARKLGKMSGLRVKTTFLGAHAIPFEFSDNAQGYVDFLCHEVMPAVVEEGLADAVDVYCEKIAFTLAQTEKLFACATSLSLPIKCHAEQLSNIGASKLAAGFGALSCDHLEFIDEQGIEAMAQANSVAVLLPGAYYYLRETRKPPIELLRKAGIGMAVATDCNPGSSPTSSLRLIMNMACQFFLLTVPEVLSAVTFQAARALGIDEIAGEIAPGKVADLLRWSLKDSALLCYHFGYPLSHKRMIAGEWR